MKLGQGVEWSIHCLALLGVLPEGRSLRLEKMAEYYDLPVPYLRKHFQALSRAGLVTTVTGPSGGYRLSRSAQDISLLDIYIALEGDDPCFRCSEIRQQGPTASAQRSYARPCNIASAMWQAEKAWRDELKKATLAKILEDAAQQIEDAKKERSAIWLAEALKQDGK